MDNLKDVKEDAKLENCVVIQVDAEEEDVMEHFCGISSDFVDNFEFQVEEVKVITALKIPQCMQCRSRISWTTRASLLRTMTGG